MPSGGGQSPPSYYLLLDFSGLVCAPHEKQKGRELPSPCRMKFKFEPPFQSLDTMLYFGTGLLPRARVF